MPKSIAACSVNGGRARIIVAKSASIAPSTKAGSAQWRTARMACPKKFMRGSLEQRGDRLTDFAGRRPTTEIAGDRLPLLHHALDRRDDCARRVGVAEVLQHHRARPDLGDRVRDRLAGDVW